MSIAAGLLGLLFLILVAYRGFSVILFAPVAAMIPLLLTHPSQIPEAFTGLYMEKAAWFLKMYFPLFLLGAVFGKLVELSGFARSIVGGVTHLIGPRHTVLSVVTVCALLTYGGVSLFVVVFAVYPFAAEMFRRSEMPKRLMPATIALGSLSFTMDATPGTPQIQNIIPSTFFGTTAWAAPVLGTLGSLFILLLGMTYLQWQVRRSGEEGYGTGHLQEPEAVAGLSQIHPMLGFLPLFTVPVANAWLLRSIHARYPDVATLSLPGLSTPISTTVASVASLWALEGALLIAIGLVVALGWKNIRSQADSGSRRAVAGALLAVLNTGSEFGFGAVMAALPGFLLVQKAMEAIHHPLLNVAVATNVLAGITGSASGGLSIALAAMAPHFITMAHAASIPMPVVHRVAAMASGGMDALPHNGAIVTLLSVTGLTHRQAYGDIFVITLVKTAAVFAVILLYTVTGVV